MVDLDLILRWTHVVGAAVLLGTGAGIAFFMLMAHRTKDPKLIAHVADTVVLADFLFTASAVLVQPITGVWLAHELGWSLTEPWILASIALYLVTGVCWLPVVAIQIRLRTLARTSAREGVALPARYFRLFKIWFLLGIPAFSSVLAILWLMLARPAW